MTNITLSLGCVLLSLLAILSSASSSGPVGTKGRSMIVDMMTRAGGQAEESPFVVGQARLKDKTPFMEVPEINKMLVELKLNLRKFTSALASSPEPALKAAHPRNALIAKRHYFHMLAMNQQLDTGLGLAMQQTKKQDEFTTSLHILYHNANRAVHYHLTAHFPQINQAVAEDYMKMIRNYIPLLNDDSLANMRKAQIKLAEVLVLIRSRNPEAVAWIGNYLSLAVMIGDIISTRKAPLVILADDDVFRLVHIYRFTEYLTTGPKADEFMQRPITHSLAAFKTSLDQLQHFMAGSMDKVTDKSSIVFLLGNKSVREAFPQQHSALKLINDAQIAAVQRKASEDIDKIVASIGTASSAGSSSSLPSSGGKRSKSNKARKQRKLPKSNIDKGTGKRLPVVVVDDDNVYEISSDDSDSDADADDVLQAMVQRSKAAKQSNMMNRLLGQRIANVQLNSQPTEQEQQQQQAPGVPAKEVEKFSYDPRDMDYAFVLIGEYIYQRYLTPFLDAYKWNPEEEVIWTDILYLLEHFDSQIVHDAIKKAGMTKEFFVKAVHFYQMRSNISHPPSVKFTAQDLAHKLNMVKDVVWPQFQTKFMDFFSSFTVNDVRVDPKNASGPSPLRLVRRPRAFMDADSVEASLASFDLYQYVLIHVLYPILRNLGLRKVEQIRQEHIEMLMEVDPEFPYTWEEIHMLLYSFRRTKNNLGHPKLRISMIIAYLDVFREDPSWDSFFSVVLARAQSELPVVRRRLFTRD